MGAHRGFAALVAGVLVSTTFSGAVATSADAGPPERTVVAAGPRDVTVAPQPARTAREIRRYWTRARMAQALPIEDVVAGLAVTGSPDDAAGDAAVDQDRQRGAGRSGRVPRTAGKLFFSDNGADYVCSAAAINTRRRDQVITAGHCVHTGPNVGLLQQPRFYSDWLFVPRYHRGRAPDGKWVARTAWAFTGWVEDESFRYDQAIVAFRKHNGRRLTDVVGGNDVVWGKPQRRWGVRIWGWPAESPYDGETAHRCDGRTTPFEDSGDAAMHQCDLNGGASGGPWFLPRGRTVNTGRIWAVTSRRLILRPVLLAHPIPHQIRRMIRTANR